jgi:hypothetical protein
MCPHMRTVLDSYCPLRIGGYDSEDEVRKPPAPGGGARGRRAGGGRVAARPCARAPATAQLLGRAAREL